MNWRNVKEMENNMSEELKEYLLNHKYFLKQTLSPMLCLLNLPKCDKCGFGIIISIWGGWFIFYLYSRKNVEYNNIYSTSSG